MRKPHFLDGLLGNSQEAEHKLRLEVLNLKKRLDRQEQVIRQQKERIEFLKGAVRNREQVLKKYEAKIKQLGGTLND